MLWEKPEEYENIRHDTGKAVSPDPAVCNTAFNRNERVLVREMLENGLSMDERN